MAFLGFIPQNHEWCLKQLLIKNSELIKHFPDVLPEFVGTGFSLKDLITVMSEEFVRCGLSCMPMPSNADFDGYLFGCITLFMDRQAYATAFGICVLGLLKSTSEEIHFETALKLRKKLLEDLGKYEEELKKFEPLLKQLYTTLKKPVFYYLDMMLDDKYFFYLGEKDVKYEERTDIRLTFLHKRWDLEWFPNGKTPYLYKLLEASLMYLNMQRFMQVRYLIAVTTEIMKTVNQDTGMFRKLQEMLFMVKTMYWGMILSVSELKEVLLMSPGLASGVSLIALKDKVIDFGISLPDGEDPDLPTQLLGTEEQRKPIYERLWTHKRHLEKATLPYISEIYQSVLQCDINYYDANNGNPSCCGKHNCNCSHPH